MSKVDRVQVLRVVLYEGPRDWVEKTLKSSIHGTKYVGIGGEGAKITVQTLSDFPLVIGKATSCSSLRDDEREG